jgi:hypothetical protein
MIMDDREDDLVDVGAGLDMTASLVENYSST